MTLRLAALAVAAALGAAAAAHAREEVERALPLKVRPATYTCGYGDQTMGSVLAFPKRRLRSPARAETAETPWAAALRRRLARSSGRRGAPPRHGWRFLARNGNVVQYGYPRRDGLIWYALASLDEFDAAWRISELATCRLERVVRGFTVTDWGTASEIRPWTRRITIVVHAGGCVSGEDDFRRVEVSYGRRSVNLLVLLAPVVLPKPPPNSKVVYACLAIARRYPKEILLPAPIGNRALRDASYVPPRVVKQAPR